jgi:hypothetical protein
MRFGFVMAGLGAACAIGVVNNRVTILGTHIGPHYDISSQQEEQHTTGPGVDLATRDDAGELIDIGLRLDELSVLPGKVGPFVSFTTGAPPPNGLGPQQTLQSSPPSFGFGGGGGPSFAGGVVAGASNGTAPGNTPQTLTQPPGTPADPPSQPDTTPPNTPFPGFIAPGGAGGLEPFLGVTPPGPGQPPTGGTPPPPGPTGPNPPPPIIPLPPPEPPQTSPGVTDSPPPVLGGGGGGGGGGGPATPAAVPEPSAWSVMLLGLGVAGLVLRRRRPVASSGRVMAGKVA